MIRIHTTLFLATAILLATAGQSALAKGDPAKGQALAGACSACHGPDGNSMIPTNPSLAQQHADYTAKQLAEFKNGTRANAIMAGMAAGLTSEAMNDLGAYFQNQKLRHTGARDRELAAKGRKLYRGGDVARGIPACSARSANASAVNGVFDAGLANTVHPAASAAPALRVSIAAGKFHGVMSAATPIGCFSVTMRRPCQGEGITSP